MRILFPKNLERELLNKIKYRKAVVGVVGIGYVGKALAIGSASANFHTLGFTRNTEKASHINQNKKIDNFEATADIKKLSECDIICICVPTPIHENKTPDLEPLESAINNVKNLLKNGALVILESTVACGTTRNIVLPILKQSGLKEENEFFLSFSPERIDPVNKNFNIYNTPKVVSGLSRSSCDLACLFYKTFIKTVVPTSSLEVAEMSKLVENTFRFVNISFVNELLDYTNALGIDLWEVIDIAATKPFGFLPHYPGPGIGGHCIPVDPYYLIDDAKKRGLKLRIVEKAGYVNDTQSKKIVSKTLDILKLTNGEKKIHSALIVGLSYKENTPDHRESPAFRIWKLLHKQNIEVSYHDPYIPKYNSFSSEELSAETIRDKDIIIVVTPHQNINYSKLLSYNKPILDAKNALKNYSSSNIYRI